MVSIDVNFNFKSIVYSLTMSYRPHMAQQHLAARVLNIYIMSLCCMTCK